MPRRLTGKPPPPLAHCIARPCSLVEAASIRRISIVCVPIKNRPMLANDRLNDVLIEAARSLLQYVGESWPWTSDEEADERATVERIVAEQRETVQRLAELLDARGHLINWGSYPSEYTSLHYVALDYLLDQLVAEQQSLEDTFAAAALEAHGDAEAEQFLTGAAAQAARHRRELEALIAGRQSRQSSHML